MNRPLRPSDLFANAAHEGLTRSMMVVEGLAPELAELAQDEEE